MLQRAHQVLTVPEGAIEFSGESTFVHILTDSVPEQKFSKQPVTIGMSDGIRIEIKQGLQKGQQVRGAQKGI